ncbi:type II secretion system protein [Paenibacillus sp. S-38]|uniref:type II secretion system protein n=1 Tax=Paenibacillus sp. S-38 TaxID=3416710 RepID=UPI003CEEAB6C
MMKSVLKRFKKEEKGFTLIELLAVIVILGIIAAIAVPMIGRIIDNSETNSNRATARQIYDASRLFITSGGEIGDDNQITLENLIDADFLQTGITLPSTGITLDETTTLVRFNAGDIRDVVLDDTTNQPLEPILAADLLSRN